MTVLGIAGTDSVDPITFIVTLGGFIPSGFGILYAFCILGGFLMFVNAGFRQIETSSGRGNFTTANNLLHALFGAALAGIAELIGGFGKGVFGDFQSASVLVYVAREQGSFTKVAVASLLLLMQFIGAVACVAALRGADRLSTGQPRQSDSWGSVFWFGFGGLVCVFIQQSIGLLSAVTGMGLANFINNL